MTPERWQRVERLFVRSLELDGAARASLLDEGCRDDPALRTAVEAMLCADGAADDELREAVGHAAAAAARGAADLWCGRQLGAYRIERQLASGGLDFGIAKLLDATASPVATVADARLLTPLHASPEQVRGEPVTTASDVYILGVLLYQLLTGCSPYRGPTRTPREIEQAICEIEPVRPSAAAPRAADATGIPGPSARLRKELAGDLDTILLKALRKEPEERYASVDHLTDDIGRYLGRRPVAARPASWRYRTRKFLARRAGEVVAGSAVVLLVTTLVVYYTMRLATERDLQAQQRETAQQVSDFMVGLFENADPQRGDSDVTARELLAQGVVRIDELRASQPLVAASLMLGMGRAHGGLAARDTAVELLTEALHYLADVEVERARYTEGRELLDEALAIREQALGTDAPEVGRTLYRLAYIYMRLSEYDAMRDALERSLRIYEQTSGPGHPDTGNVVGLLGSYYWVTGDYAAAREHIARGLAIVEEAHGTDSIRTVYGLHNLGLLEWQLGNYRAAHELYLRELTIKETHLGPDHPDLAHALYGLATTSKDMGNYGDALDWFERTIALQEAALGPDDHYLAMTLSGYGFALLDAGLTRRAGEPLERALGIFERNLGPAHIDLRAPLSGLANLAIAQGRYSDAKALLERARDIVETQLAPDHADVLRTIISIGELHAAAGDDATAREYFARGLAGLEQTLGLEHPFAAPALAGMAATLATAEDYPEAESHYVRAIAIYDARGNGDRRLPLAEILEGYAELLRRMGREAEADDYGARARRIRQAVNASVADRAL